jgi:pimeloyl-ACP methyl ester carboxylesterase
MILAKDDDFFDLRAARAAYEDIRKVHRLLGSGNSAAFFAGSGPHGFTRDNREAMYAFFMKQAGIRGSAKETGVKPVDGKKLYVLPGGETHKAGSRRAFEFTADAAARLARRRGKPSAKNVIDAARRTLHIPASPPVPQYRTLRDRGGANGPLGLQRQFAVETAPGIQAIVTVHGKNIPLTRPPKGPAKLYIGNVSSQKDLELRIVKKLARGRASFITVDPRGMGQSFPRTCGNVDLFMKYNADFMYAMYSDMLGEEYLGGRVLDVLRTMDFLLANGVTKVNLIGRGLGSIIASFAALLHPSEPRVEILHHLPSYRLLVESPVHKWPRSVMPRGILIHFDLPDVYRALGKRLRKSQPWGPGMKPLRKHAARS